MPRSITVLLRRATLLVLTLAALALTAAPASAAPRVIGFGEQDPAMFADARWQQLQAPHVRVIVGWDALRVGWERRELDYYLQTANAAGAKVLLSFGRSRTAARKRVLPTAAQFRAEFKGIRARYPFVREFITWNEANLCAQPTCRKPAVVAGYYKAARAACPSCTVLAPSMLDTPNMPGWVKAFERAAGGKPPIWGLHNYLDANTFKTTGTKAMLRATKGKIWLTETGGIVSRGNNSPYKFAQGTRHAAKAMNWLFNRLVPLSSRIERAYVYHWRPASRKGATWDSAVVDKRGRPREAFTVVARAVAKANAARRPAAAAR